MPIEQIKPTKKLVDRLKIDPVFSYTCGFNILEYFLQYNLKIGDFIKLVKAFGQTKRD